MQSASWLVSSPGSRGRIRLFCFPYAGGGVSPYLQWQGSVRPSFEILAVQLPGRGARIDESPKTSLREIIEPLAEIIGRRGRSPFAFFGHSFGALIAFELARYCDRHKLHLPIHLFVSGCDAPRHETAPQNLHRLPDDQLIDSLRRYNGTPNEALENRELMTILLPAIRADFAIGESYVYESGYPLPIPITVLAGRDDNHVCDKDLHRWAEETTRECSVEWFHGGHFFINDDREAVLACIKKHLAVSA